MNNINENVREAVFDAIEATLESQLRAVRKLKSNAKTEKNKPKASMSQPEIVYNILKKAGKPLHISEIILRAEAEFDKKLDRESLASALTKKIKRHDRFCRTDRNTFGLLEV